MIVRSVGVIEECGYDCEECGLIVRSVGVRAQCE